MKCKWLSAIRAALLVCVAAGGCGGTTRAVRFSYEEPPACELPASVGNLVVAEFRATSNGEDWGRVVSRRLAEALVRAELPHQVRIIDSEATGETRGADSQPVGRGRTVVDTSAAVAFGKAVGADAVVYGTISVAGPGQGTSAGRTTQQARGGPGTADGQACAVTVRFVIDEVAGARTLGSLSLCRRYDPHDGASAGLLPGAALPTGEAVVEELIAQCVDGLVAWLCPQKVWVNAQLQVGRTRLVLDGNRLARGEEYAKALDLYLQGVKGSPGDDGAVFNAGLMYEALGQLDKAAEYYDRAAAMRPGEHTDQARRRLDERRSHRE